jgi:hypothetical protein
LPFTGSSPLAAFAGIGAFTVGAMFVAAGRKRERDGDLRDER